jgi:hypothetical protein
MARISASAVCFSNSVVSTTGVARQTINGGNNHHVAIAVLHPHQLSGAILIAGTPTMSWLDCDIGNVCFRV